MKLKRPENIKEFIAYNSPALAAVIIIIVLILLPTGYEGSRIYKGAERVPAQVLSCDDSNIIDTGLVRSGEQECTVRVLKGIFRDSEIQAVNLLTGSLEQDKIFVPGDKAYIVISYSGSEILSATMTDHYRLDLEAVLALIFAAVLIIFAGKTGVRSVLSFILTVLCIWKLVVPLYLKGYDPIITGGIVIVFISVMIVSLVYGFDKRALASALGITAGIAVTAVTGIIFTDLFKIHGAVMAYSESLLYSESQDLDLTKIFMASIFIGSSGAVMDVAVDITSAVAEIVKKKPDISRSEAIKSGLTIGRAAMGTITTTLLLAYSGSCIALLMVFMAQGTPIGNMLNYKYVAAEIVHTVVGSFGLVCAAPLTAVTSGLLLADNSRPETSQEQ
ncbi:MAG: YibE/F family protein [Oscillospiraceae bacterium]